MWVAQNARIGWRSAIQYRFVVSDFTESKANRQEKGVEMR